MTTREIPKIIMIAVALLATATFVSCFSHTAHFEYKGVSLKGWHRSEIVEFRVPPVEQAGYYIEEVGIRASKDYPFQSLNLLVRQEIVSSKDKYRHLTMSDTISIPVYDSEGMPTGDGVNLRQYQVPLKTIKLQEGDSIQVTIRHNMQAPTIPGISDVGMRVVEN